MLNETHKPLKDFISDLATQSGIALSKIAMVNHDNVNESLHLRLLHLSANDHLVSMLINQSDIDNLLAGVCVERLETKARVALSRLHLLLNQ
jgi:hypothetical protein